MVALRGGPQQRAAGAHVHRGADPAHHRLLRLPALGSELQKGGAPPGLPGPGGGPGAGWGRGRREDEPPLLEMLPGAAQEDVLGCGGGAVRVLLLGRLHAARQADLQEVRCSLHPDMVCHQLECFILPIVLRGAHLQVHREAVCEAEIQISHVAGVEPTAERPVSYPVIILGCQDGGISWQRECCRFFGDNGLTLKVFFTKAAPFGVLWTLTNYLYLHAIKKVNTTDVSVLFCCNKAFVFLLSWIVLRDRFMGVRIVAAILAIAGIVMMTYADGFHSHSVIGIALVVGSASMSALYKVLFKLLLGSAKFGEAALFLSILGVFNILFITCIPVILYFTKVEYWSSFDDIPWGNLCGFSVLLLTFNIVLNFGIAVTYPTLMSVGIVFSVPVNAVVDHYTSKIVFNGVRVIAIIIIGLGFLLLLLPEEWDVWLIKLLTRLKVRKKEEPAEGGADLGSGAQSKARRARPSFAR
ncbi:putative thiamine transporter SLC35F3 isoform X2 [Canis lupus familiaris]|uniref:putative thiamine transporter SLC35F3 isoform X2 n=2 Tax=Canis lupus familiaris TaxID=9615 RepID=UPI000BAA34CB|nr:putative thiamine transporter SLC35F3 isoform X2 [Canis lupus familiaris]|eukprot:XP_022273116.1 putative thiamine transporter SLC35F3 isoform X2 [Canis lupus familiaris]